MDWMPTGRRAALERLASIQRLDDLSLDAGHREGRAHERVHGRVQFEERRVHSVFAGPTLSRVFKPDWDPEPPVATHPGQRQIGRLRRVDPGTVWADPDGQIVEWLSKPETVLLLGRELSLRFAPAAIPEGDTTFLLYQESGKPVVVGSWHRPSTHAQLAELLAHAAREQVSAVVWICGQFLPEQRKALDWLDSVTDSSTRFYAVELELWAIDDSNLAPRFNLV
ncbi:MAG: hypothetical protein WD557_13815 [Dehalococcoidia bacterium]